MLRSDAPTSLLAGLVAREKDDPAGLLCVWLKHYIGYREVYAVGVRLSDKVIPARGLLQNPRDFLRLRSILPVELFCWHVGRVRQWERLPCKR